MTVLTVRHVTVYRYRAPVGFGNHRMMFRPRDGHDQKVLEDTLAITPEPTKIRRLHDVFGNFVAVASFDARAEELSFTSNIATYGSSILHPTSPICRSNLRRQAILLRIARTNCPTLCRLWRGVIPTLTMPWSVG